MAECQQFLAAVARYLVAMKENSGYEKMREDQFHNCRLKMQSWPRNVSECIGMYLDVLALLFIAPRMYLNVSGCIGFTFHSPQNVSECIGMYLDVLALLFIAPRMYLNVSGCIGFTLHSPQDDPIHYDTFQYIHFQSRKNNQYFMFKFVNIYI